MRHTLQNAAADGFADCYANRALVVSPSSSPEHAFLAEGEPYAVYRVFPGGRWAAVEPDEEVEASRAAPSLRPAERSGYTGWSQAWVLCLAARLRDGVLAERAIETLLGPLSSRSLLDLHPLEGWPGGAVFQIDGNLGAVAGIAELLV